MAVIASYRGIALALALGVISACLPAPAVQSPAPSTPLPTVARPRFELATYMYALQTKGKIRVATVDNAPPFAGRDAAGVRSGFEIDLARELARAIFGQRQPIDAVIEWISVDDTTKVAALTSVEADVTLARLTPTTARATAIDLSDPYFVTGTRILVRSANDEIRDIPDLETRTACVTRGTSLADQVRDANPFAKTLALDTYASCLGALQQGQVDAIVADEGTLWDLRRQDANTKIVGRPFSAERYVIGIKKNSAGDRQGFLAFLNSWLAATIRDGTWARLYALEITPLSQETKTSPAP